ncbi:ATP-grasp fold amidoligase family protein [Vibrio kanaloae]|uniref:ATP-grasp fold amidoligase family protein n=1 Tax=Vibrio kanaloae TaxID=170673 RepID=UPI0010BDB2F2|nr:ATP-grasp fold amidoligase family protein [Vibrio kanaloae]TKF02461.1 hypothetical protein FCV46_15365 [Vibrio kanaloae]TKF53563.1 hypothetical protein FCV51_20665 [Vibrio kanaloae]
MPSLSYKLFSKVVGTIPLKPRLELLFYRRFGERPELSNPITFNEKIQYRKLNDRRDLLTQAAGKLESKRFVSKVLPSLFFPKTLWEGNCLTDVDNLDMDLLPQNYVFKGNHTSQTIEIVRHSKHLPRSRMKKLTNRWLRHDQSSSLGEWAYKNVEKKVFIEEFLDFNGQAPDDYKFFVYSGKVHFIQLDSDRFTKHRRNMFDRDWNELDFKYSHERKVPVPIKPTFLSEMIAVAEELGKSFDFIRVDLYHYRGQVTFGELTVYPGAGFEKFPSRELDQMFGRPWDIQVG